MRILVTGGAGFIGSHLSEKLLQEGNEVVCVDNFNDYYDPRVKRENLRSAREQANFRLFEEDIRNYDGLEQIFREYPFDAVVHLAARAGVRPSIQQPRLYQDVNIRGTLNLLELARHYHVPKFIFASSSSVYGNNKKVPFSEDDNVDHPISPYAATKKAGELITYTYHHLYGISASCIRFFTVYGPRQRPDMAIHKFTRLIDQGEPIPVFGDGNSRRDYTYISDIVDGLERAIERCEGYEIYNLGDSKTIGLLEMIREIESALGKKADLKFMPAQPGDVDITYADISKARRMLGYEPKVFFEQGIRNFVAWYRDVGKKLSQGA